MTVFQKIYDLLDQKALNKERVCCQVYFDIIYGGFSVSVRVWSRERPDCYVHESCSSVERIELMIETAIEKYTAGKYDVPCNQEIKVL